jgi:outer membrane protein OmpA-like peptidoglycan-associated protein
MKKLILPALCLVAMSASAQDLVKNPGFTTDKKITTTNQISKTEGWSNANGATVDLFNGDACKYEVGIPNNYMGEQSSTSNYAGIIAYYDNQRLNYAKSLINREFTGESSYTKYAEYLQGELTQGLTAGKNYEFSFKVSLSERSSRAIKGLGVYFSNEALASDNVKALTYTPQIVSSEMITDKTGWTTIKGTFTAKGGEKFFTIGAFEGSFTVEKTVEELKENDNKKAYYYIAGASCKLGADKDSDNDGVADKDDKCPTTAAGIAVDAFGCALDGDEDGVPDTNDKCLTTPAGVKVDVNGCAIDTDGDGIADYQDDCPTVKGIAENKGCPKGEAPKDTDGDGVVDANDACPTVKGTVNGCPDRDGDGVADKDDACPDSPGLKELDGCVLSKEELEVIRQASEHIYFNSGSAVIKSESYADLDKLAAILVKHPEVKASVEGHTDSQGRDDLNLKLSKARAKAAADYLINKGVKADHITSEGYGETQPIADNSTSAGRAKNRRVIIKTTTYKVK